MSTLSEVKCRSKAQRGRKREEDEERERQRERKMDRGRWREEGERERKKRERKERKRKERERGRRREREEDVERQIVTVWLRRTNRERDRQTCCRQKEQIILLTQAVPRLSTACYFPRWSIYKGIWALVHKPSDFTLCPF